MKKTFFLFFLTSVSSLFAQKEITLEDIWHKGTFNAQSVPGFAVMNDGESYIQLDLNKETNIMQMNRYSIKDGKKAETIVQGDQISSVEGEIFDISNFTFSDDEKMLLFETDIQYIYRHSYSSSFYVYNRETKNLVKGRENVRYATFSPNGKAVAYVWDNNLYVLNVESGEVKQITFDGEPNRIINGAVDWVYEEEFSMAQGYRWDPSGKYIAYYHFNEEPVKRFSMDIYNGLYPKQEVWRYPKAGEANSIVKVKIANIEAGTSVECFTGPNTDIYLPRIKWTAEEGKLSIQRLNRLQNQLEILLADAANGLAEVIYDEKNKYYIDITDNLNFLGGNAMVFTSEKSGRNHVWKYDYKKKELTQLTTGEWDVDDFLGVDEKAKRVYFTSSANGPMNRDFRWASLDGKKVGDFGLEKDGWHHITVTKGNKYFVDYYSKAGSPNVISLYDIKGKKIKTLEDNAALVNKMKEYNFSKQEFEYIDLGDRKLSSWIMKPANMEEGKKYPVLMYVYGGPGSQTVTNRWGGAYYLWFQYLVSKGYVVVSVDNRGTGFMGEEFKKMTYLQLGKYEIEDQIAVGKKLAEREYIDKNRIGIFGWSYGGYMSSLGISKGHDVFKTAVAVAPVTNWRFYDNIYTERFMRTPQENGANYDNNSPINFVKQIKGNYLIIHGTADDNVHFQNSVEMVEEMIKNDVKFDSEYYPNKNHSIGGGNTRLHLFKRISHYLFENL